MGSVVQPTETRFWVKDNGIGIQAKDYDQVLVMFKKLNNKKYKGTGIGLATCKAIVEKHRGGKFGLSQNSVKARLFTSPSLIEPHRVKTITLIYRASKSYLRLLSVHFTVTSLKTTPHS
ncbi:MAG: hypothetical protein LCI00_05400 [Chloroflexi bacterium]|nr:hypothetical protein [Chloroflexota bacterium]